MIDSFKEAAMDLSGTTVAIDKHTGEVFPLKRVVGASTDYTIGESHARLIVRIGGTMRRVEVEVGDHPVGTPIGLYTYKLVVALRSERRYGNIVMTDIVAVMDTHGNYLLNRAVASAT